MENDLLLIKDDKVAEAVKQIDRMKGNVMKTGCFKVCDIVVLHCN